VKRIALIFSVLFFSQLVIADADCDFISNAPCQDCYAPMVFSCNNGAVTGNIAKNSKVKALAVSVFRPTTGQTYSYWLKNPPDNLDNYSGDLSKDKWILDNLRNQGLVNQDGMKVDLVAAKFDDHVQLSTGPNVAGGTSAGASQGPASEDVRCGYANQPSVATVEGCGKVKSCFALASCYDKRGLLIANFLPLSCLQSEPGVCPSATACYRDKAVGVDRAFPGTSQAEDLSDDHVKSVK
jgi:hypothetical protein